MLPSSTPSVWTYVPKSVPLGLGLKIQSKMITRSDAAPCIRAPGGPTKAGHVFGGASGELLAADSLVFDLAIFMLVFEGPRQEERSESSVHLVVWKICWRNKLS